MISNSENGKKPQSRPLKQPEYKTTQDRWDEFIYYLEVAVIWLGNKSAYIMAAFLSLALWYIGAYFTVRGILHVFPFLNGIGDFIWGIPVGISMVELIFYRRTGFHVPIFLIVSGVDVLTTLYGSLDWAAGRELNIGAGLKLPKDGFMLIAPITVISFLLTFGPEQLFLWAWKKIIGFE